MKQLIGTLLMITGVVGGLYVGGWIMFIHPILEVCKAFDAGTLTGMMIGIAVLKCIFAGAIGSGIAYVGIMIGSLLRLK